MEIFPATIVLLLIWAVLCLRDPDSSVFLAIVTLPFGMFAAVELTRIGGLSLLAPSVLAMFAVGLAVLRAFSPNADSPDRSFDLAVVSYGIFTAYAVFSAIVLVRIFEGQFLVFPMGRALDGVRVDFRFLGIMSPLSAGPSNISQAAYIGLSFGYFVVALHWFRRQGAAIGERAILFAACINIILGILDFLKLDALLSWARTANYALANQQAIGAFDRIIGGFPEPSTFGGNSAAFFGYFAAAFVYEPSRRNAVIALLSLVMVIMSFSVSGYLAVIAVLVLLIWRAKSVLYKEFHSNALLVGFGAFFLCVASLAGLLVFTPLPSVASGIIETLFLNKADSVSGLERGAWARSGIDAFWATMGLGAGAGSLRSNGLIPVLLGNVGLPGALACLLFIYAAIFRRAANSGRSRAAFFSAQAAAVALLSGAFVSATGPDLGLAFVTFAAFATAMRFEEVTPFLRSATYRKDGQVLGRTPLRR